MLVLILKNDPCLYRQVMLVQCSVFHTDTIATLDTYKDGQTFSTLTSLYEQPLWATLQPATRGWSMCFGFTFQELLCHPSLHTDNDRYLWTGLKQSSPCLDTPTMITYLSLWYKELNLWTVLLACLHLEYYCALKMIWKLDAPFVEYIFNPPVEEKYSKGKEGLFPAEK